MTSTPPRSCATSSRTEHGRQCSNAFARRVNPLLASITGAGFGGYYWVLDQAEVATDVMFATRPQLLEIWPDLVCHASTNLSSTDVLRFLGRKLHPSLKAEVLSEAKRRPEGWRIKHRMARNWVKVYDKASVLRVETTINNPREFRVLRVQDTPQGRQRRWCEMRKGVANTWRFFQVGAGANRRYLDALASVTPNGKGIAALDALCRPRTNHQRHAARLNPLSPTDLALFRAVVAGEHTITGFRNHHIAARLYPRPPDSIEEAHRRCQRISRLINKLRVHGLVAKVPRARLYRVTPHGYRALNAAITIHDHQFPAAYLATT